MNSFALLQALVFEPKKAFNEISERPRILFPLLTLIVASAAVVMWYTSIVDLQWLTDQQIRNSGFASMLTEAQIEARVASADDHPTRSMVLTGIATAASVVILRLLEALYYLATARAAQRKYRQWLSLACWTGMPSLLAVIPAAILLATATSAQIDQASLQALSLNSLIFHRMPGDSGYTLLTNVNLLQLVGSYLAAAGIRAWSGRSWVYGLTIAFLPMVLFYGIWALIVLGRS